LLPQSLFILDLANLCAVPYFKNRAVPFFIDLLLHVLVLYACAYNTNLMDHTVLLFTEMDWPLITAIVFVGSPASIIMAKLLEGMSDRIELDHKSLPNAGTYLGSLERPFVLTCISRGRWEAIGFLMTAKAGLRFT